MGSDVLFISIYLCRNSSFALSVCDVVFVLFTKSSLGKSQCESAKMNTAPFLDLPKGSSSVHPVLICCSCSCRRTAKTSDGFILGIRPPGFISEGGEHLSPHILEHSSTTKLAGWTSPCSVIFLTRLEPTCIR